MEETRDTSGEQFIHQRNPSLHTSEPVEHEQQRRKLAGDAVHQKPAEKLADWMEVLEQTHMSHDEIVMDRIRNYYHDKYVFKEENIPQSYWNSQGEKMVSEGRMGDLEDAGVEINNRSNSIGRESSRNFIFPEWSKAQEIRTKQNEQRQSLDKWINYLTSDESFTIPTWAKYWIFTGVTKLSTFDKKTHSFTSRNESTMAPFPDLDAEALALTADFIKNKVQSKENPPENTPELEKLLQGANFGKLYAYAIENTGNNIEKDLEITEGKWVKFSKGSDPTKDIPEGFNKTLSSSLQGHSTGWCTASSEDTARKQLRMGDFYVYYSNDRSGTPSEPRVAIRMQGDEIQEIRGIEKDQNIDSYMNDVVSNKIEEFGEKGAKYKKTVSDMKHLTEIEKKRRDDIDLSREDILFLYEITDKIIGFGHCEDPRIDMLKHSDFHKFIELGIAFNCDPNCIDIYYNGDIDSSGPDLPCSVEIRRYPVLGDLQFPEHMRWGVRMPDLVYGMGTAKLPKYTEGEVFLPSLKSLDGIELPEFVGGDLGLWNVKDLEDSKLPDSIGGTLWIPEAENLGNAKLPRLNGLSAIKLSSSKGITFNEHIPGHIELSNIDGLQLPSKVEGCLTLKVNNLNNVILPDYVGGNLTVLSDTLQNVTFPKTVGEDLTIKSEKIHNSEENNVVNLVEDYFASRDRIDKLQDLILPKSVGGDVNFNFRDMENIVFPTMIGGNFYGGSLKSAKNVKFPQRVEGFYVRHLTNYTDVTFPLEVWGEYYGSWEISRAMSSQGTVFHNEEE